MLHTILGDLYFTVDGKVYDYESIELVNKGEIFKVDKRYKIEMHNITVVHEECIIECIIKAKSGYIPEGGAETGERLALISFNHGNIKLSIGVEGDIDGVRYEYRNDRLVVRISRQANIKALVFYIAWIAMKDEEKEYIYTCFAADPTLRA